MMEENKNLVEGNQVDNVAANPPAGEAVANETEPTSEPPKPVGFFSFKGRMDRLSYFVNGIVASLCLLVVDLVSTAIGDNPIGVVIYAVGYFLFLYRNVVLTARRFHDFGKPGTYVIPVYVYEFALPFAPLFLPLPTWLLGVAIFIAVVVNLAILFYPGQDHENQWGMPPKKFISWN